MPRPPALPSVGGSFRARDGSGRVSPRPDIAASWRRSHLSGVRTDAFPEIPIHNGSPQPDTKLRRAAEPLLDRLASTVADACMSIMLTDREAQIVDRRVGIRSLGRYLDDVVAVPGARYAEDVVGTNGLGTAVETRKPVVVAGEEHFTERLKGLTCAATPIYHPVTGRLEGVLDITAHAKDANPLMLHVISEAAREIQAQLYTGVSVQEQTLFEEFITASRQVSGPLVSLNGSYVIANSPAFRLLQPEDQVVLWEQAMRSLAQGDSSAQAQLSGGDVYIADIKAVTDGPTTVGVLLRLRLLADISTDVSRRSVALPGLVGESDRWRSFCGDARLTASSPQPLALVGESGVGKLDVAKAVHEMGGHRGPFVALDAAEICGGEAEWLAGVRRAAQRSGTVFLSHVELLSANQILAALAVAKQAPARLVVAASVEWAETVPQRVLSAFPWKLEVPPLRDRADDIPLLVRVLASRNDPGRRSDAGQVTFSSEALRALMCHEWPGNVRELESVVIHATARCPRGEVTLQHLPSAYRDVRLPHLSAIDRIERDAIVRALREHGNNKHATAAALGLSRSTLYRKIASYRITGACRAG